jgi:SAM-dependent methyltransferase
MPFPDDTFDVVWGLESTCYAFDKHALIGEVARVLRRGGRLVIADGFLGRSPACAQEEHWQRGWLQGWAVPNLAQPDAMLRWLREFGFRQTAFEDVTAHVLPSSERMYRAALIRFPLAVVLRWLGLRSAIEMGNIAAAIFQRQALQRGLWRYGVMTATK